MTIKFCIKFSSFVAVKLAVSSISASFAFSIGQRSVVTSPAFIPHQAKRYGVGLPASKLSKHLGVLANDGVKEPRFKQDISARIKKEFGK
jgi:hypothetical protein